jgi:hypothetical protein
MYSVIKCYLWTAINPETRSTNLVKVINKVEKKRRPKSDSCVFRVESSGGAMHDVMPLFRSLVHVALRLQEQKVR